MTQHLRPGSKTLDVVLKTDEHFGHDGLWLGPRGRDYGNLLPNPKPYQHANLYPDPNSSYWFAFLEMPEGSVLLSYTDKATFEAKGLGHGSQPDR